MSARPAHPDSPTVPAAAPQVGRFWRATWRLACRHPETAIGALFLLILVVMALFARQIAGDPNAIDATQILQGPSADHLFGTDHLGRDLFSRVLHGARVSL